MSLIYPNRCQIHRIDLEIHQSCQFCLRERSQAYSNYIRVRNYANISGNSYLRDLRRHEDVLRRSGRIDEINPLNEHASRYINRLRARIRNARNNLENIILTSPTPSLSPTPQNPQNPPNPQNSQNSQNPQNPQNSQNPPTLLISNIQQSVPIPIQNNSVSLQNNIEIVGNNIFNYDVLSGLESVPLPISISSLNKNSEIKLHKDKSDEKCVICYDNFTTDSIIRKMNCEHIYHIECIDKWFETKKFCPLCRKQF